MQTEFPERYITLGLKIAYYRKKAGFTQESFAERIGKSVNFIAQVEGTGTVRGISLETLFKIAQVLNVAPSKLLEDDWLRLNVWTIKWECCHQIEFGAALPFVSFLLGHIKRLLNDILHDAFRDSAGNVAQNAALLVNQKCGGEGIDIEVLE